MDLPGRQPFDLLDEIERSTRGGRSLAILVLDLDWFKEFNDRFGHAAGDRALAKLGEALKRGTRTSGSRGPGRRGVRRAGARD